MRTLFFTLFFTLLCCGAEDVPDLPRSTVRVIDQHLRKLEKAEKEYKEAVEAANRVYARDLEREMTAATKDADLDAALWIRNEIERVKALEPKPESRSRRTAKRLVIKADDYVGVPLGKFPRAVKLYVKVLEGAWSMGAGWEARSPLNASPTRYPEYNYRIEIYRVTGGLKGEKMPYTTVGDTLVAELPEGEYALGHGDMEQAEHVRDNSGEVTVEVRTE